MKKMMKTIKSLNSKKSSNCTPEKFKVNVGSAYYHKSIVIAYSVTTINKNHKLTNIKLNSIGLFY
jgi:hypothetical protein